MLHGSPVQHLRPAAVSCFVRQCTPSVPGWEPSSHDGSPRQWCNWEQTGPARISARGAQLVASDAPCGEHCSPSHNNPSLLSDAVSGESGIFHDPLSALPAFREFGGALRADCQHV